MYYIPGGLGSSRLSVEEVDSSFSLGSKVGGERGAAPLDLACDEGEWELKQTERALQCSRYR